MNRMIPASSVWEEKKWTRLRGKRKGKDAFQVERKRCSKQEWQRALGISERLQDFTLLRERKGMEEGESESKKDKRLQRHANGRHRRSFHTKLSNMVLGKKVSEPGVCMSNSYSP